MEPSSPEQESVTSEVKKIGQEFQLFSPDKTTQWMNEHIGQNRTQAQFLLELDMNHSLPLSVRTRDLSGTPSAAAFTPFKPESSYVVDERDMTLEGRKKKLLEVGKLMSLDNPFDLEISTGDFTELVERGLLNEIGNKFSFPEDIEAILKRLRLQVTFPQEQFAPAYEAACTIEEAGIRFNTFRPTEMPVLPVPAQGVQVHRDNPIGSTGLPLRVNGDLQRLQQIRGQFILEPQKKEVE